MNRKVFRVLLAGLLTGSLLMGCGTTGAGGTQTEAAEKAAAGEAETAETPAPVQDGKNIPALTTEPLHITLWDIATESPDKDFQEAAVARFMTDYPNITVEQVHIQNDTYKQQLIVAMSSGKAPNMYVHWGGGPMLEYYKSGFVNDITERYSSYDHPEFVEAAVAQSSFDGKVMAIPFGGLSGCNLYYNRTIFEECGITELPATIEELEKDCEILKEHGYTPFSLANASQWTGSMWYMYLVTRHSGNDEFNAAYAQENGGSFTSEAFVWASDKIQDWVRKGYFPDGVNSLSADDGQDRQLLYNNTCAMMLSGSWQCRSMARDNEQWYKENIAVMPFPKDAEAEAKGVPQDIEVGTAIGMGFSFNCWKEDGSVDEALLDACYVLATQYYNDEQYNSDMISANLIPSIKGVESTIEDANLKQIVDMFFSASDVQLWYDQYLPASVIEVHKNCMTELFGLEKNGKEIGEEEDRAMQAAIAAQ